MKKNDVISVCNALMDILVEVEDSDLKTLELTKGIMHLVDSQRQQTVLNYFANKPHVTELGGSCLNAIRTLAALGHKTAFAGMIKDDKFGNHILQRMSDLGIRTKVNMHGSESTGTCIILITPDGERTMNTNLGASRLYNHELIPHNDIAESRVLHFSGYQWDSEEQKHAIQSAINTCHEHDTLISFDIADPFVVSRNQDAFAKMIAEHADIVFANKEEARLLYGSTPQDAAKRIADTGSIAVIKLGAEGALIQQGSKTYRVEPVKTSVVDTTAAGDMFAAGFLHGHLLSAPLDQCGRMAATLASDVISRIGATVSQSALKSVSSH
jgi:sugar/nucleoside kinase (ribokinase family)